MITTENKRYQIISKEDKLIVQVTNERVIITANQVVSKEISILQNAFISADFISGSTTVEIGTIPAGAKILNTIIDVTTAGSGSLSVGSVISQGVLVTVADNDLNEVNKFVIFNDLLNVINTTYNCFFINNLATGKVTIYYS